MSEPSSIPATTSVSNDVLDGVVKRESLGPDTGYIVSLVFNGLLVAVVVAVILLTITILQGLKKSRRRNKKLRAITKTGGDNRNESDDPTSVHSFNTDYLTPRLTNPMGDSPLDNMGTDGDETESGISQPPEDISNAVYINVNDYEEVVSVASTSASHAPEASNYQHVDTDQTSGQAVYAGLKNIV